MRLTQDVNARAANCLAPATASLALCVALVLSPSAARSEDTGASASSAAAATPDASIAHSATKATTFKIATVATNMAVFSIGTESLVGGGLLTAFNVSKSWLLFTANDYAWDTYFPTDVNKDSRKSFDTGKSFWRTTGKFLTYKPVDTVIKFASIYLYTGSTSATLIYGTASSVLNTGVFYLNNVGWDVYDWWQAAPEPAGKLMISAPHVGTEQHASR